MKKREIELLIPAKNLACGIAAVDHGADAVYIGAPQFGARVSASNSLEDISALVDYAHLFSVKVYVTVNVILKDEELKETEGMIWSLYHIGVDALIIQDMGILELNLPPIALHSSTQNDNRDIAKAKFLEKVGFRQIVLARELSLNEIHRIHEACPDVLLEVFVHGALCVSYSGQCYVSELQTGRSANRGACSQFCRLPFDLEDSEGNRILSKKYLLSMKDLNQSNRLEELLDAGATSLKVEGRLKDISYVKNITATYRQMLDKIFLSRGCFKRSSIGHEQFFFTPQVNKSFSRESTNFMLDGRQEQLISIHSPKSLGEEMGYVKESRQNYVIVAGVKPFHSGDGVCYIDEAEEMRGFRVNRVEGNKLFLQNKIKIAPKTKLFRNYDHKFEKEISKESAVRKIDVEASLSDIDNGFRLTLNAGKSMVYVDQIAEKELARTGQVENIKKQLSKLGGTPFTLIRVSIELAANWFIPSSVLNTLRQLATVKLVEKIKGDYVVEKQTFTPNSHPFPVSELTYLGNVMNVKAQNFYLRHGARVVEPAFEKEHKSEAVLMYCKHCIRYTMGWCPTYQKRQNKYKEPLFLLDPNGERFKLVFDCKACLMKVLKVE